MTSATPAFSGTSMVPPERRPASAVLPMVLAAGAGVAVAFDPLLGYFFPQRGYFAALNRALPYLYTVAAVVLAAVAYGTYVARHWLFEHRYEIAVALLVTTSATEAANAGQLKVSGVVFMVATFLYLMALCVENRPFRTPLPVTCFLVALTGMLVISIINGLAPSIIALYSHLNKVGLIFLITNIVTTPRQHQLAIKWLIATAVLSAVVGIASEIIYFVWQYPLTFDPRPEFQFKSTPFGEFLRATAFFTTTQGFAHLLLIAVPLVLFARGRWYWKGLALALLLAADICTFNPGSWLVVGIVFLLAPVMHRPRWTLHYLGGVASVAVIAYFSGAVTWCWQQFLLMLSGNNIADRVEYLQNALQALARHPWLGNGLKNIERVSPSPIHNVYMQMTADLGIFGGALFAAFILYLLLGAAALIRTVPAPEAKRYCRGLFLALLAMATQFMFEPFYDNYLSWLLMALVAAAISIVSRWTPPPLRLASEVIRAH